MTIVPSLSELMLNRDDGWRQRERRSAYSLAIHQRLKVVSLMYTGRCGKIGGTRRDPVVRAMEFGYGRRAAQDARRWVLAAQPPL